MQCACGCGHDAGVYKRNSKGNKKGATKKFIMGHSGGPPERLITTQTGICKRGHPRTPENVGVNNACRICETLRYQLHIDNRKAQGKVAYYLRVYNLTIAQYEELLSKQNNCCIICEKPFDVFNHGLQPCVDHVHDTTKKVRGILCKRCNQALGLFLENIKSLENAIAYLKEHN